MKGYPLIYSRTKVCDYVSGFLVRPEDLDDQTAAKYVSAGLNEVKYADGLRHMVFAVGDYVIYGGTACVTSALIKRIRKERNIPDLEYDYKEFGSDKAGRPLTFFIGFAVKRFDMESTDLVPDIDLYEIYRIYLDHLKKQWCDSTTKTEILKADDAIELKARKYSANFIPEAVVHQETAILKNYNEQSYQDVINYYYHELMVNLKADASFLSGVLPEMLTDKFAFKNTSLFGISVESYMASASSNDNEDESVDANDVINNDMDVDADLRKEWFSDLEGREGKKTLPASRKIIWAIVITLLVGSMLLLTQRKSTKKDVRINLQSTNSVQRQQD